MSCFLEGWHFENATFFNPTNTLFIQAGQAVYCWAFASSGWRSVIVRILARDLSVFSVHMPRWMRLKKTDGRTRTARCSICSFSLVSWSRELPAGQIKLSALPAHRGPRHPFHKNRALNPSTPAAIYHLRHRRSPPLLNEGSENGLSFSTGLYLSTLHFPCLCLSLSLCLCLSLTLSGQWVHILLQRGGGASKRENRTSVDWFQTGFSVLINMNMQNLRNPIYKSFYVQWWYKTTKSLILYF